MRTLALLASWLSLHHLTSAAVASSRASPDAETELDSSSLWSNDLSPKLSREGLISCAPPPRWSSFQPPRPSVIVNVETEADVVAAVKYCGSRNIPFLAQNGGIGWATFDLGPGSMLINLARLNQVTFNAARTQATIGGGSNINNIIARASAAGALVVTGNCNCVGALGATLGGGYGNLIGLFGFGVDNVLSLRVVTADGNIRDVTAASDPEFFWALRGAGPNLGIVVSAVVKSYPVDQAGLQAWAGSLIFSSDKLEQVVQAIQDLKLKPETNVFMYFVSGGPPNNEPVILLTPFMYKGTPESGRAAFASLYALGPVAENTGVLPYSQWNTAADVFCVKGDRKPAWSVGVQKLYPSTWRQVWNEYVAFQKQPGAQSSVVIMEAYDLTKAKSIGSGSAAFAHRNVNFNAVAIPWYTDSKLDKAAQTFGTKARDLWRAKDDLSPGATYINFGHGDEPLDVIYGTSVARLRAVKKRVDPQNRFNQWFNIR